MDEQRSGLPDGPEINIPVGSDYFRDYARLLAVAKAAEALCITEDDIEDYIVSLKSALAAVEDLL